MKGNNFLLAFASGGKTQTKQQKKTNNRLTSSKNLMSKTQTQLLKKKQRQSQKDINDIESRTSTKKPAGIVGQIEKLTKKIQQTQSQIEQTQKKLDVDLFLKKQKEKKQQYAKDINKQYQIQKKKRQQTLYKKHRVKDNVEIQNSTVDQTNNVKSAFPMQLFKILQTQKRNIGKSQTIFTGHHLDIQDLIKNERTKVCINYQNIGTEEKELLFTQKQYATMSIKKVAQNSLKIQYFPIKIEKGSLQTSQNYENLMNALVLMPQHLSSKYFQHKEIGHDSFFLGKMFYNGIQKTILTNDQIETKQLAHRYINVQSRVSGNKNFGPTIVEKMFRKISSNKTLLDFRSSSYTLFGLDAEIVPISNKNYLKQNFTDILRFLHQSGQLVGFLNVQGHNNSIYQDRIYPLKGIFEIVEKNQQQQALKKKKRKSKKSKPQTIQEKELVKKTVYQLGNPWKGHQIDPKGLNKFQLLELFELFNQLIIIRDYPKSWICKRINLEIFSTGPLAITNNQWTKNNQYNFTITSLKSVNVRIVMRKQYSSDSQAIIKKNEQINEANNLYGFLLFSAKEGESKITCMKMQSLIVKSKSNDLQGATFNYQFQKGSYIIIPYSNKVSKTSYQFFNLDFFIEKQESLSFGKAVIQEWRWNTNNQTDNNGKIIQSLQSKQIIQKPKIQDVQISKVSNNGVAMEKLIKNINQQHLVISKKLKLSDLIIPGKLKQFLINPQIQIASKTKNKGPSNKSQTVANKQYNNQVQTYEKQQALNILLGYDILQSQDIDRGQMMMEMEQNQDVLDFANYGLGKDGLTAIMENLMSYPIIRKLNLSGNQLDDSSVVFLCYYIDKGNRIELRQIDLSNNNFGKIGKKALQGLLLKYQNLHVMY